MRKLAIFAIVSSMFLLVSMASAQQGDVALGFGALLSPGAAACNAGSGCPEKGGIYPAINADVIFHQRLGFAYEVTWRGGQGAYGGPNGQPYRPIINDFNVIFQPHLTKKIGVDLLGGVGWQDTRLYSGNYTCTFGGCTNYTTSNHFLVDVGGGVRYYVWNHLFVRPEARYYNVLNNTQNISFGNFGFSSSSLLRVGASIGYTIGGPE